MHTWQLQEAKSKLTQLLKEAEIAPQMISKHGEPNAVVINFEQYKLLCGGNENLVSLMHKSPLYGLDLDLIRDDSVEGREVDL